jgi:hypothetical protein
VFMRLCSDYVDVINALRDRTDELQLSREAIDSIAGLSDGYAAKLLSGSPSKVLGPISMGPTLETLGLRLMLVEDTAATARTIARRTPVVSTHRRLGNKNNSKPSPKLENAETIETAEIAAPQRTEPPETRSHLRVIQTKSARKFG